MFLPLQTIYYGHYRTFSNDVIIDVRGATVLAASTTTPSWQLNRPKVGLYRL